MPTGSDRYENDQDRRIHEVEKRVGYVETRLSVIEAKLIVQEEHIKNLGELKSAHIEFTKIVQELKLDFMKLKTQIMTIAAVPGVVVVIIEAIRLFMGK